MRPSIRSAHASAHSAPVIALITWICTGGSPFRACVAGPGWSPRSVVDGEPECGEGTAQPLGVGDGGLDQEIEVTGEPCAPWNARASAPTTRNSTPWAFKYPIHSSKSAASSIDSSPQVLDSRHAFLGRPGQPMSQRWPRLFLFVERRQAYDTLQLVSPIHGVSLARGETLSGSRVRERSADRRQIPSPARPSPMSRPPAAAARPRRRGTALA